MARGYAVRFLAVFFNLAMSILVTTPTGNVGSRVVARLIEERADVSVFARKPDALAEGVRASATVHQGDLEDADSLTRALEDASALFFVIPPNMQAADWRAWQRQIARNAASALEAAGAERVVFLSSAGAQHDGLGPISGLGEAEEILREAAPHVTSLRAGYFMENLLQLAPSIAREHAMYHAFPPEMPWPLAATGDIGDVAAEVLLDDTWSGWVVRGVHGPADLSHAEAAAIIGDVLGEPVEYVQVPLDAVQDQMRQMGFSDDVVASYGAMIQGMIDTPRTEIEPRTEATTTPTSLADFAQRALRPAIEAAVA
jgi:uncharacterized protein YbjT (DUF2867 family)